MHYFIRIFILIILGSSNNAFSQSNRNDLILLQNHKIDNLVQSSIKALKPQKKLDIINPIFWLSRGSMFLYQRILSPQLAAYCVYQISCSNFSKQVIHEFGLIKGVALSADRLMRCNGKASVESEDFLYDNSTEKLIDEAYMYSWNYCNH